MKDKALKYSLLAIFILAYLLNACTPHTMESFRHLDDAIMIIGAIFRWISLASFIFIPLVLLYDDAKSYRIQSTCILPATLISLCFSGRYFQITKTTAFDIFAYTLLNAIVILYSIYFLYKNKGKNYLIDYRDIFFFLVAVLMIIPLNIFMDEDILVNNSHLIYKNFGGYYFAFMLVFIIVSISLIKILKTQNSREEILFFLSMVLVYHIFTRFSYVRLNDYQNAHGIIGALPLYICSFGIIILPFAIYSGNHKLQTLAFLINTPGAIIVLVNPTAGVIGLFHYDIVYFFFSHILLFAVTIQLPIYLNGKPDLNDTIRVGGVLFVYFAAMIGFNIIAQIINANYDPNFSFVSTAPLPVNVQIFGYFRIYNSVISPVYVIILWIIHWALSFITLGGYMLINRITRKKSLNVICEG